MNINPQSIANGPIQSMKDYVDSGGKPEEYNAYVEKRTAELAAEAMAAAEQQAKTKVRIRVTGQGWRPGQTHYKVLAKAPQDLRIQEGEPGYEKSYKHEPPLSLPIGKVSEVPVRDERHLEYLKRDPCLTIVSDGTPTWEEEQSLVKKAVEEIAQRGTSGAPAAPPVVLTAGAPAIAAAPELKASQTEKRSIFELPEREMRKRIAQTTDFAVLSGWFVEAESRQHKLVFSEVLNRMMELHGELNDFLDKAMPPPPKPADPPKPPAPPVDPATALAGSPQAVQDKAPAPPVETKTEATKPDATPKPEGGQGDAKTDAQGAAPTGNAPAPTGQGKPEEPKQVEPPKPPKGGKPHGGR